MNFNLDCLFIMPTFNNYYKMYSSYIILHLFINFFEMEYLVKLDFYVSEDCLEFMNRLSPPSNYWDCGQIPAW